MRITRVQAVHCDAGWRPWTFVKVDTDVGLVGWGECSDSRNPYGVAGSVRDLEELLVGEDPRAIERLYWDMLRAFGCNTAQGYLIGRPVPADAIVDFLLLATPDGVDLTTPVTVIQ